MVRVFIIVAISIFFTAGCCRSDDNVISDEQYAMYMRELGLFEGDIMKPVDDLPLRDSIFNTMLKNVEVHGRRFKLGIDRDDVVSMGYPSIVYDVMCWNIAHMNNTIKMVSRSERKEMVETFLQQQNGIQ